MSKFSRKQKTNRNLTKLQLLNSFPALKSSPFLGASTEYILAVQPLRQGDATPCPAGASIAGLVSQTRARTIAGLGKESRATARFTALPCRPAPQPPVRWHLKKYSAVYIGTPAKKVHVRKSKQPLQTRSPPALLEKPRTKGGIFRPLPSSDSPGEGERNSSVMPNEKAFGSRLPVTSLISCTPVLLRLFTSKPGNSCAGHGSSRRSEKKQEPPFSLL